MGKILKVGMEPWRYQPTSDREAAQATYDRLSRKYKGLEDHIIRAAWRRTMNAEPTQQIIDGIRDGKRLRFM